MSKNILQKQKSNELGKCLKCKKRDATKEDQMCDNCRFVVTLENIIKNNK